MKSFTFETNLNAYLLKSNFGIVLFLGIIFLVFQSCNSTKYVPENEYLLSNNTVFVNNKKNYSDEINDYVVQRPNQLVLGVPLPLHFYNLGNKNFESDFDQWKITNPGWYKFTAGIFSEKQAKGVRDFKYGFNQWFLTNGEPPVLFDRKKATQTVENLIQHYYNEGFFKAKVTFNEEFFKHNKIGINYYVTTDSAFTVNNFETEIESQVLDSIYQTRKEDSFIKKGTQFKLLNFVNEQARLDDLYRNSGIYRFNKNAITFEADSTNLKYKSDVLLSINDSISNVPFVIQKIRNVSVYTDYSYASKDEVIKDSLRVDKYNILAFDKVDYNPKYLLNSVFIEPGEIYRDIDRELTRKHFRSLGNFRSVDIKYTELENNLLDANVFLTPLKKYGVGINTELTHSNIRQLGISGKLTFLNRNLFKGAEILSLSVQGSFLNSKDAADSQSLLNAWEIGADASLELPRFLLPLGAQYVVPKSMFPKTTFTLGSSLQKNIGLDKQKFTGIIDYTWESKKTTNHSLQLLNIQYIKNLNLGSYFSIYSSEFEKIQEIQQDYFPNESLNSSNVVDFITTNINGSFQQSNPAEYQIAQNVIKRYDILTEDVLVPSAVYTYTYTNSENYKDSDFSFFRGRFVSTGNLLNVLATTKGPNNTNTVLKTPIAQYIRTDLEYKKFWNLSYENVLAFRTFVGVAIPYGNSTAIPFSRSFFIGGPNDLRAWKIYDLGPGSTKTGLEYNVGNFKFLSSLEYRFQVLNSFKAALFIDAGNIWDISNSDLNPDSSKLKGLKSLENIAVGTGFGLRYDLSFILLRLDLGFKTFEPYLPEEKKWFTHTNFKNTVFNFGISYPF